MPPGWPCSTPPTSTRSRSRTARSPRSCSPPPTSGCSSPRPPGTPTRSRGTTCAGPPSAARRSRSCSTGRPTTRSAPSRPTSPGCSPPAGSRTRPLFVVTEGPVGDDGLLPAESVADVRGWLDSLAEDAEARTMVVRQTLEGAIRTLTRRTHAVADAETEQVTAEARLREDADRAYDDALAKIERGVRRRHAAARRGAGPLAGVRRHRRAAARPRAAGRPAPRPARERGARQAAAGRTGHGRGRGRAGDADPRARRGSGRARGGLVAGVGPGAALLDGGRRRPRAARRATSAAAPSAPYATGSRACSRWSAPRAPTSAAPPGSWRTA